MERKCWLMNMLYNIWYYIPIWQREKILSLSLSQFVFNDFTRKLSRIVCMCVCLQIDNLKILKKKKIITVVLCDFDDGQKSS